MFRKIKYIFIIVLVIFIGIISYIIINSNQTNINENVNDTDIDMDYIGFNSYEDTEKLLMTVIVKNGDWSKLLLTDNFKNKYNEKDGILGETQFDKVEYKPYHNAKYSFEDRNYFVITQGKKKTAYTFNLIGKNGSLDDIKYFEIFNITDEYGNELDSRVGINEENFNRAFYMLSRGAEDERSIAVTDRFHRKYLYFLDLFEHYSPLEFNGIEYVSEKSSWDRKEAYFVVDSRLECKKREYIVNFTLDDRGYLDEVVVKRVSEEEYERNALIYPWSAYVFFKNGNWMNLKLTEKFKSKFNSKIGCFSEINNIDIDKWNLNSDSIDSYTYIIDYAYIDGTHKWFCEKYTNDNEGYLDDIEYIPIEYYGMQIEEAKELYLKEHNK